MLDDEQFDRLLGAVEGLGLSVRRISSGGTSGPEGLETLMMAVSGPGIPTEARNLVSAVNGVSESLDKIASALELVAEAITDKG